MAHEETRSETRSAPTNAAASTQKGNGAGRHTSPDELLDALANEASQPAKPGSSLGRALRDVVIVAALLGGGTYLYYNHVTLKEKVTKLAVDAADKMEKDDLASLKEAEAKYQEILAVDSDNAVGLAGLAETYFHQYRHGLDTRKQSEDYLAKAVAEGSESPERYATQAYLDITAGRADNVVRELTAMFEKDVYHPKLAHAIGWAMLEQGKYIEANRYIRTALDTDFNAIRFLLSLAEIAHRQGGPEGEGDKAAIRNLSKIQGSGMNPEHELGLTYLAALRAKNYGNVDKPAKWIQTIEKKSDSIGPVAKARLDWAGGELALALGDAKLALEKAEAAIGVQGDFPPFYDLKARALAAQGKTQDAYAAYEAALSKGPMYRGIKWSLAELKSKNKDDGALALLQELESTDPNTTKGPEYEVFRGEHYLRTGKMEEAKQAFTRAAELGDDADILFGLARITFEEERKKGPKADLERVATDFGTASEARQHFPELQEYMGGISLWNFQVDGAESSYEEAEKGYKRANKPVPEILAFYDRVIESYEKADDKSVKKDAEKKAADWKKKKKDYLASVAGMLQ